MPEHYFYIIKFQIESLHSLYKMLLIYKYSFFPYQYVIITAVCQYHIWQSTLLVS